MEIVTIWDNDDDDNKYLGEVGEVWQLLEKFDNLVNWKKKILKFSSSHSCSRTEKDNKNKTKRLYKFVS